jgi:hypothetical protein
MLKNILNLNGIQVLSKKEQQFINGGVDKCCIKIPGQDPPPGCNNNYECRFSYCYCGNQQ